MARFGSVERARWDITRLDGLGRTVVAVPAGTVPAHWVKLTAVERASLVEPPPRPRTARSEPGHCGFKKKTVVGCWVIGHPS